MKAVYIFIILVGLIVLLGTCATNARGHESSTDSTTMSLNASGWHLGDEIDPFPLLSKTLDCDDGTLYSYYYIMGENPDLDIKIVKVYRDL